MSNFNMASGLLSQDNVDISAECELDSRRTKIRTHMVRGNITGAVDRDSATSVEADDINGKWDRKATQGQSVSGITTSVHESPVKLSVIQQEKDKRTRPNRLQKGKLHIDKRKLREKRRSTGVGHLPYTESTGDSLDDDEEEEDEDVKVVTEAKRNTTYNEVIDVDQLQTSLEVKARIQQYQSLAALGNKMASESPTVLMSPKNVVAPKGVVSGKNISPPNLEVDQGHHQVYDSGVSPVHNTVNLNSKLPERKLPWTNQSKFSSETTQSFKPNLSWMNPGKSLLEKSTQNTFQTKLNENEKDQASQNVSTQPRSPLSFGPNRTPQYELVRSNMAATHEPVRSNMAATHEPVRSNMAATYVPVRSNVTPMYEQARSNVTSTHEPVRSSVLSRYQIQDKKEEPASYRSRFHDNEVGGTREPIAQTFVSSFINRDDDVRKRKLEKDLERERDENRRLQNVLEEKDRRIAELERRVAMLNRDVKDCLEDMEKIQIENQALIQAVGHLSTNGGDNV